LTSYQRIMTPVGKLVLLVIHLALVPSDAKRITKVDKQIRADKGKGSERQLEEGESELTFMSDKSFKVMQWNILAEGLSTDGFLGVPVDRTSETLIYRPQTEWDKLAKEAVKLAKGNNLKAKFVSEHFDEEERMQPVMETGTMAMLIRDTVIFKEHVITPIEQDLIAEVTKNCSGPGYKYDQKEEFRLLSVCASDWQVFSSPMYEGHEALGQFMDKVVENSFESPTKVTRDVFANHRCKEVSEQISVLNKCNDMPKIIVDQLNKLINALERFNRKWGLKYQIQASSDLLDWGSHAWEEEESNFIIPEKGRGKMLVDRILTEEPDIVTLEEMDHFRFFQDALGEKYSSSLGGQPKKYNYRTDFFNDLPEKTNEDWTHEYKKTYSTEKARLSEKEYIKKFLKGNMKELAFLPKRLSNAQNFHPYIIEDKTTEFNDNDGVAIFWKTDRFEAEEIKKHVFPVQIDDNKRVYPGKEGGILGVLLRDTSEANKDHLVWVLSTHVPSGDKEKNELERVQFIKTALAPVKKWYDDSVSNKKPTDKVHMVIGMDGNSHPEYKSKKIREEENMATTLISGLKELDLKNFGVKQEDEGMDYPSSEKITVSVNKMRGIASSQPWKIGEYQCDRIDYVFRSRGLIEETAPNLPRYEVNRNEVHGSTPELLEKVYNGIMPTKGNPSDHYPIITVLSYSDS